MKILVTGGMGFIGSNLVRMLLDRYDAEVHVLDAMTYAARPKWVNEHPKAGRATLWHQDLKDRELIQSTLAEVQPDIIFHLAAESHVCRSIEGPKTFVDSNILGTWNLIESMRQLGITQTRLVHVSTDEVFGELDEDDEPFDAYTQIQPRSPYAASKAASDHLVMAYVHTYGLNAVITNCSNNYGPNQHEEKLIPKAILSLSSGLPMTIYGNGDQIRDWIWVDDHCEGLISAALNGRKGKRYLFGGNKELRNRDVVYTIAEILREQNPSLKIKIKYTNDRPTDDFRYAIDTTLTTEELGWKPSDPALFQTFLKETIQWYLKRSQSKN